MWMSCRVLCMSRAGQCRTCWVSPTSLLQRTQESESARHILCMYEGSVGVCPHLSRARVVLSGLGSWRSSSATSGGQGTSSKVLGG